MDGFTLASSESGFFQQPPALTNHFLGDNILISILQRILPKDVYGAIRPDLEKMGQRVITDVKEMGDNAEDPANYPRLRQYDAWCRRVDELITSEGWRKLHDVSAEEGLVAIAYERKYGQYSRIYQMAKQYLFMSASATYACPLSMTDGAARCLEVKGSKELKEKYFQKLTSRDPSEFYTSGQWMTERPGGSDVSNTETIAECIDEKQNLWSITGFKWFSSATDANITMLLARTKDPKTGKLTKGSKGLSLFLAEVHRPDGSLNGVRIHRLKQKFGTKGLPTAELELKGMVGHMIGEQGRGVATISSLLNITRIYSGLSCVTAMRGSLAIAKEFAKIRTAFGRTIRDHPLHLTTLSNLDVTFRAACNFAFYAIELLGAVECNAASHEQEQMLRLITPIFKLWAGKIAVPFVSEAMEALGGQGYMEESGLPRALRDVQVNAIWEGTTNILSLDVLRVAFKTKGEALQIFDKIIDQKLENAAAELKDSKEKVREAKRIIGEYVANNTLALERTAREVALSLARILAATLLIEHASWMKVHNPQEWQADRLAAERFIQRGLVGDLSGLSSENEDYLLVYGQTKL
ncbi:uncharacterized protein VTP21DRAFT_797 [Calcarisporiella thermophila]|uniref:uncharacterized protein n=1 Tax=Calcarisporiella thermophila TaxID=911321 RepID=UPI003744782E